MRDWEANSRWALSIYRDGQAQARAKRGERKTVGALVGSGEEGGNKVHQHIRSMPFHGICSPKGQQFVYLRVT